MNNVEPNSQLSLNGKCFNLEKNMINVVIYHGWCSDGFGSAFVIWHYYKETFGINRANSIKYIGATYQKDVIVLSDEFINEMTGKNIILVDFSYKYNQLVQLINVANSFIILDHHLTAKADLINIPDNLKIFDMKRSGCGITWDYFYPNQKIPKFLAHIQDRDIWTFNVPESPTYVEKTSEFVAYFYEQKFDFDLWETYMDDNVTEKAIVFGTAWLEYKNLCIKKIIKKTSYIIQEINNQFAIVLYVNSADLKSDIGNRVFKKYPFGDFSCVWDYDLYNNESSFSLRSTDDRFDVSKIASLVGGGGHRNASGKCFSGLVSTLPFDIIDDHGILTMLKNGIKGHKNVNHVNESYMLFKVKEIKEEWMQEKYMDLIKRKCNDCLYIVFETISKNVHLENCDINIGNFIPMKNYDMIYNEKAITQPEKKLQYAVLSTKDCVLTLESTKEFDELFSQIANGESQKCKINGDNCIGCHDCNGTIIYNNDNDDYDIDDDFGDSSD